MSKAKKIEGTTENWESGALGCDEQHAKKVTDLEANAIDEALGLQPISIRLQKSLIEDLKLIAEIRGLGYQPLIKQTLRRFADAEIKLLLREFADQKAKEEAEMADEPGEDQRACA